MAGSHYDQCSSQRFLTHLRRKLTGLSIGGRPCGGCAARLRRSRGLVDGTRSRRLRERDDGLFGRSYPVGVESRRHPLGRGIQIGHNAVEMLMARANVYGLPG